MIEIPDPCPKANIIIGANPTIGNEFMVKAKGNVILLTEGKKRNIIAIATPKLVPMIKPTNALCMVYKILTNMMSP
jgi:hypothetical protein